MWTLTFKDINDATITVEIEGGNGTLTGAAKPLITRELETDDPFEPVRYQTGYINLVGTDGADIRPADTFDRPVTIKKNGAIVWLGYIAVEEWNNSMSEYPQTVQLPLISALGVLGCVEYQAELFTKTIGQVLYKALNMSRVDWSYINYGIHTPEVFGFSLVDYVFRSKGDSERRHYVGINADLPSRENTYTALSVIKEICLLFGWQIRESGSEIFLSTADAGAEYSRTPFASIATNPESNVGAGISHTLSLASTAQSRSMLAPKNQVRIVENLNPIDEDVMSLENILDRLEYEGERMASPNPALKKYFYDMYNYDSNVAVCNYSDYRYFIVENMHVRDPKELRFRGACLCRDAYIDNNGVDPYKDLIQTKPCLTLTQYDGLDLWTKRHLAILQSEHSYNFIQDGYIDLEIDAEDIPYDYELLENPGASQRTANLFGRLKYGDQWFDGTTWVGEEKSFLLFRVDSAASTLQYRHNCNGKPIPLPKGVGSFELSIEAPAASHGKYVRINKLSLTIRPVAVKSKITDYERKLYNASCVDSARDTYSVEHSLHFMYSTELSYVISYGRVNRNNSVNYMQDLLNRMQTWYRKAHTKLQLDARGTDFKPMDTASFNSYNCIIGARQINWRDAQTRLTLYSI